MAESVNWHEVVQAAQNVFRGGYMNDPRWTDAAVITIVTELMRRGRELTDEQQKGLDESARNFVEKSRGMIKDSPIKDSSDSSWAWKAPSDQDDIYRPNEPNESIGPTKTPADPDDVYRPDNDSNSSIGDVTPPQNEDDIYRLADDGNTKAEGDETAGKPPQSPSTPNPESDDDYTGIPPRFAGWSFDDQYDPFDAADTSFRFIFGGSNDQLVEPWDNYEGIGATIRFDGGGESPLPWERVNPKY